MPQTLARVATIMLLLHVALARGAEASPITFFYSSGGTRSASATFEVVAGNLQVTLTNTSAADALVPADILTAIFFDITGSPTLSRDSAVLGSGSSVTNGGTTDAGGGVGGEWAFADVSSFSSIVPGFASYGIGSAGFGVFGPGDLFPGSNLSGPISPDGIQYGITSAGDNPATGNMPLLTQPLIRNAVVFTLGGVAPNFDPSLGITNLTFVYGTSLPVIPEPASVLMFGAGLGLIGLLCRRRWRS